MTVVNIILGVGLLSLPYAMSKSGYAGAFAAALCCVMMCMSGKLISWSMDAMPPTFLETYPSLGVFALGEWGRRLTFFFGTLELMGGCCLLVVVMWTSLELILTPSPWPPESQRHEFALLLGALLQLVLCCFGSIRRLATVCSVGCISTFLVMLMVVSLPILDPHKEDLQEVVEHAAAKPGVFPSISIFALSVAGHSAFPCVRAGMRQPRLFTRSLDYAYLFTTVVVASIALVGYWYWGDSANVLLINDLQQHSPYMRMAWARLLGIDWIVNALVFVNTCTTVPILVKGLSEIVVGALLQRSGAFAREASESSARLLRVFIVVIVLLLAKLSINVLGAVEKIIGSLAVLMSSLVLPFVFYAAIHHRHGRMSRGKWLGVGTVLAIAAVLVVQATIDAVGTIVQDMGGHGPALGLGHTFLYTQLLEE